MSAKAVSSGQWAVGSSPAMADRSRPSGVSDKYSQRQSAEGRASDLELPFLLPTAHCSLPAKSGTPPTAGKCCPICRQELPLSEFGKCEARADGKNLYCKSCVRKKVAESRRALKEYRAARKANQLNLLDEVRTASDKYTRQAPRLSPVERVREAIRKGARTQKEIRAEAKLGEDEVCDALAEMLLWTREVDSRMVDNNRHYFLRDQQTANSKQPLLSEPPATAGGPQVEIPVRKSMVRAAGVRSGFASIPELMPARITGERKVG